MSKAAVISGVYVDCKFMPGLKSARIAIDIPIEHSNEFLRMFGAPDRASPVAVAIARLNEGEESGDVRKSETVSDRSRHHNAEAGFDSQRPPKPVEPAKVEKAKPKRSSLAYLMCNDPAFQAFMANIDGHDFDSSSFSYEWANLALKDHLGIKEKKELDTDPEAAARFDSLRVDFEMRDHIR